MSVQALTWVLDCSPAKDGDRLVLVSIANHAHPDGSNAHPTVPTIARESRLSTRSVQYAVHSLEHGFEGSGVAIRREGIGPNRAVLWRVLMDEQARTFKGIPRRLIGEAVDLGEGANVAPPEGATRCAPEGADVAPTGAQMLHPEGATFDSRGINRQEPSGEPSPPKSPTADFGDEQLDLALGGDAPLGPALSPWPSSDRRREHAAVAEARRAELDAWLAQHPATPALQDQVRPVLAELARRVPDHVVAIWIAPLHAHQATDQGIVLGTAPALDDWTSQRYGPVLEQIAGRRVLVLDCGCPPYQTIHESEAAA